jgi:hypothetical protein
MNSLAGRPEEMNDFNVLEFRKLKYAIIENILSCPAILYVVWSVLPAPQKPGFS